MDDMLAAFIESFGPPEAIKLGRLPVPIPTGSEVLVAAEATTVNHVDTFVRAGQIDPLTDFPFVLGRDVVGRIIEVGDGVRGFRAGDPVWCNSLGHGGRQGAASDHVLVPADRLYRLPAGVAPAEMVAVAHTAATAYLGLFTHAGLRAGQTALVVGGAGGVGSAMVTMAARAGARVLAVASSHDLGHCRAVGATAALDRQAVDLEERIRAAAPDGVDVHIDAAGENDLDRTVARLASRGRAVVLAGLGARSPLPVGALYVADRSVRGFAITNASTAELAAAAERVSQLAEDGALRAREVVHLPLQAIADAHRLVEEGQVRGRRVVVDIG